MEIVLEGGTWVLYLLYAINNSQSKVQKESSTEALYRLIIGNDDSKVEIRNGCLVLDGAVVEDDSASHILVENISLSSPIVAHMLDLVGYNVRQIGAFPVDLGQFLVKSCITTVAGDREIEIIAGEQVIKLDLKSLPVRKRGLLKGLMSNTIRSRSSSSSRAQSCDQHQGQYYKFAYHS